jgi:signal transduction histidine kinase
VNVKELESLFRRQSVRFLGVAAMLVISLATGMILLLRSVNRDLEAARRTENFVAAVTHELRTPVAAIKLYGEMLQDGWVDDPEKLNEYYRRIVRETGRLETLVENVLEKSQLARREIAPEPGDLNEVVASLASSLSSLAPEGVQDLSFEYGEDLPLVMLIPEGVRSIVSNLVENARKYAPVTAGGSATEPIVVKTHVLAGNVVLDVMDRGPGIPHAERSKIFDAFYRVGNERTRTARGTGLGLHLVALQSVAMGARVAVLDRRGGGSLFRITFDTRGNLV